MPLRKAKPILTAEQRVLTVPQLSEISSLSRSKITTLVNSGQLPAVRIGVKILIDRAAAERLLGIAPREAAA